MEAVWCVLIIHRLAIKQITRPRVGMGVEFQALGVASTLPGTQDLWTECCYSIDLSTLLACLVA